MGLPLKDFVKIKASPQRISYFFTLLLKKSSVFITYSWRIPLFLNRGVADVKCNSPLSKRAHGLFHSITAKQSTSCWRASVKNAHVARVILGNLRTTTTTGSELQCTAQARLVNFVVVVSSTTSNKTDLNFRWMATSFSRGDARRLFLTLLTVWEWVPWKRSQRFWCTFIIMMVSYQMRNSFPCTMKSSWVFCCSKVSKLNIVISSPLHLH